jgi:hypothetical protein
MSGDLFTKSRHEQLWARGWKQAGGTYRGVLMWRRPDGALLTEQEAFAQLARLLEEEKTAGEKGDDDDRLPEG